jgi:hypothetical protein
MILVDVEQLSPADVPSLEERRGVRVGSAVGVGCGDDRALALVKKWLGGGRSSTTRGSSSGEWRSWSRCRTS